MKWLWDLIRAWGIGVTVDLPSGYKPMKDLITLKAACDSVVNDPSLRPVKDVSGKIVTTYCNVAAMRVARSVGCKELDGLMADQQYAVMDANKSGLWQKVPGCAAAAWAESGGLCFAAMTAAMLGEVHGHIAACYPGAMEFSPSLNHNVPMVANVGKTNSAEKESAAFPVARGEADYFTWQG